MQQGIQKAVKTAKKLANPKTIQQKAKAVVSGVKATMTAVKKTVTGAVSKAEKFAGTAKLGLLPAAKTAKGAMVKYAMPAAKSAVSAVKQVAKGVATTAKFTKGAALGLYDAGKSTVTGVYNMVRHPIQTAKGLYNVATNPKQTLKAIKTGASNVVKAFASGDAETRGKIIGRAAGEIALAFVGTKGVDKIAKVAKGSQVLTKVGEAAKASRVGQALGRTAEASGGFKINLQLFGKAKGTTLEDLASSSTKAGRLGKQTRLRKLANDDKLSSALRGEIKRDINEIARGKRVIIRVPHGYNLAHKRGFEAWRGYGYQYSDLQDIGLHKLQHGIEGYK